MRTLDLLNAQRNCTTAESFDAINREIALPVDTVLTTAATLLLRIGPTDPDAAAQLRTILAAARGVKSNIRKVARDLCVDPPPGADGAVPLSAEQEPLLDGAAG